mgnify:CR=1 FL=1
MRVTKCRASPTTEGVPGSTLLGAAGRVPQTLRILTVRETAWFNVDPLATWSHVSRIEEWSRWCAGLGSARWTHGEPWKSGSRFELNWDGAASAPFRGGEVLHLEDEGNLDGVGAELNGGVDESEEEQLDQQSVHENRASGILLRRVCWRAGFGPFQSEAGLNILEDGTGTLVEFVTHWQGWAALLGGRGRALRCASIQRGWLASLRETMERVGTIG